MKINRKKIIVPARRTIKTKIIIGKNSASIIRRSKRRDDYRTKPKISVVMPVYNSEKYLKESIGSILNQTFKDFELIIVDDCSTDNSLKIIKGYKDKRIKLFRNKKNLGTVRTRNIGLKKAKGKYIAVMDSDDMSFQSRLRIQLNYLEGNPHIFLVGGSAVYIYNDSKDVRKFRKYDDYKMLAWRLPKSCSIIHSSVMFRNTGEKYNEAFTSAHDYNFYLEMLAKGKNLTNLPNFLVIHRVHKSSAHSNNNLQAFFRNVTQDIHSHLNYRFDFLDKVSFMRKLIPFYLKTYGEKRGWR